MTASYREPEGQGRPGFKTVDGNDIALDVIIAYRVDPPKAVDILVRVAQSNGELEEKLIRPVSRNITRELFGELKTEDFYVAKKRAEKAEAAKAALNKVLNSYGIIVESVLPKDYRFNPLIKKPSKKRKSLIRWLNVLSLRLRPRWRNTCRNCNQPRGSE